MIVSLPAHRDLVERALKGDIPKEDLHMLLRDNRPLYRTLKRKLRELRAAREAREELS